MVKAAWIDGDWKLVTNANPGGCGVQEPAGFYRRADPLLFNLREDPGELTDLAASSSGRVRLP